MVGEDDDEITGLNIGNIQSNQENKQSPQLNQNTEEKAFNQ